MLTVISSQNSVKKFYLSVSISMRRNHVCDNSGDNPRKGTG